jgi:ABC-2 type transport system permease protein
MLRILLHQVRRDRIVLPIWILGIVLLLATTAGAVVTEYGDAQGRREILTVALATPALLALRGIPNGDSLGSALHFQSFAFLAVAIGLMNVFLATRHGRADEEKGRRELVLATPVPRLSPPVATVILGLAANAAFAVLATAGYLSAGLDAEGAVLSALALALTGFAFLGLTMIAGELTETSRAANGIGVVLVLGSYALRAAGDALGRADIPELQLEPGWPSTLSPIGWGQQTLAFTADRWWPVAALAALAVIAVAIALAIHARRQLGASLLTERAGRASARPGLRSPLALAWRLHWPAIVAWTAGSALLGLALPSLVSAIAGAGFDIPQVQAILEKLGHVDESDIARTLIAALMVLVGALAAAAGVQAMLRLREEEVDGRLEQGLAAPRSRPAWLLSFTAVAAATVLIMLTATGLAALAGFAALGDPESGWLAVGSALVQAPAALSFVAITALIVGLLPRLAIALGWTVFGLLAGAGLFGDLMNLPDGVTRLSPVASVPALPAEDWVPTLIVAAVAVAATLVAVFAMRRRDLST